MRKQLVVNYFGEKQIYLSETASKRSPKSKNFISITVQLIKK